MRRVCLQFNDVRHFLDLPKAAVETTIRQLVDDNIYHNAPLSELKVVETDGYVVSEAIVRDLLATGLPPTGDSIDQAGLIDALKALSAATVGQRCFPVDSVPLSPVLPITRREVYAAVDSELDYQDAQKGNAKRHEGQPAMTPGEHLLCMEKCLADARDTWYRPDGGRACLDFVRKVAALGVACMKLYGAPRRQA